MWLGSAAGWAARLLTNRWLVNSLPLSRRAWWTGMGRRLVAASVRVAMWKKEPEGMPPQRLTVSSWKVPGCPRGVRGRAGRVQFLDAGMAVAFYRLLVAVALEGPADGGGADAPEQGEVGFGDVAVEGGVIGNEPGAPRVEILGAWAYDLRSCGRRSLNVVSDMVFMAPLYGVPAFDRCRWTRGSLFFFLDVLNYDLTRRKTKTCLVVDIGLEF